MVDAVTPVAGLVSQVVVGGTAAIAVPSNPKGGFILNPTDPADQGLAVAENLYVSPVAAPGSAPGDGNGTTFPISPGGIWQIIPGQTTTTWVNAASNGHKFSVVYYA